MNRVNGLIDEIGYYNKTNYSFRLKLIISIALGFISLLLSPYGIHTKIGVTSIDIPWSLLFPITISIAFGWRFGLISAISGAALFPFLLWPDNGFANLLTSLLFIVFFTSIGFVNGTNDAKGKRLVFYRYLFICLFFIAILAFSYLLLFEKFLSLNSLFWTNNTTNSIEHSILIFFLIKDSINILFLTLVADLLLRLPILRRLFGLEIEKSMSFNLRIIYVSLLISLLVWFSYLGLSIVLLKHNGFLDGHFILALIIIIVGCLIAARVVIYYAEKQISALNKQKESEVYLKLQIEKMPIGYVVWDKELRVINWNPTAERIFGFTSNDTVGKTAYETIVPKHIQENVSKVWHDLKFKGIESRNINENLTKSGEIIICEWTNTPIKDSEGNITEIISMVQDITVRKKVEECLQFIALHEWDNANDNFFHSITQYLGKTLNLDYVLISSVFNQGKTAETLSYYVNGKIVSNRKYELSKTPCENVYGKKMCLYTNNIQKLFPDDIALVKMNAEGYIGQPLWDSEGKPIGLIACISKKEIKSSEQIIPILNIVATKVSSEMVRKQSKDLLESSESKYRLLFENMTSGFALHEMIFDENNKPIDYRYIAANPAYEKLTGISASSIVGKSVKELLPNLEQYWVDSFGSVALTGKPITYQNYSKEINKYFDTWVFSPKENQFAVVFNDITERVLAEKNVKESEANLNSLINNRNDAIWSIDTNYNFITLNAFFKKEYLKILNVELKKGMNAMEILTIDLAPLWKEKYDLALAGKKVVFDFSVKTADESKYYEVFLNPIISDNTITGVSALSVNITERKQAEIKLLESEKSYSKLFNTVTDAIYIQDENGVFLDVNTGVEKMYGYSREEIIGKTPEFLSAEGKNDIQHVSKLLEDTIINGVSHQFEFWGKRKNGEVFPKDVVSNKGEFFGREVLITTARDISQHKRIEKELQESEFFFKESQRAANVGSYKTDFIKGIWESSEVLNQIFGIDFNYKRSIQGWFEIVHPDDINMMQNYLTDEVILKHNSFNKEYRIKRKSDGEIRWVLGLGVPLFAENGNIISLTGTIQDITERKLANELIRETKANLSAIIENTTDSIWAINTNYEIIYINNVFKEAFLNNFGIMLEEGMNLVDAVPEPIRPEWKSRFDRAITNEHFIIEDRIELQFATIYIELSVNPIVFNGKVVGASLFSRDITERKKAEEALRISEERFKVVSESAEQWIWEVDKNGLYTYSNSIVEKILGYQPDEIVGKKYFFDFFDPENRELFKESALNSFENILAFKDFENVNIHKNGNRVIFKTSGSPILNIDGELIGYRGADIDITIQKRIEKALLESEEKYRLSFMTSPDSVNINKMDGTYVDINEGYTRLTGYTREDVIGVSSVDIDIWYFSGDRKKLVKELSKNGYVDNLESVFRCKDGSLKTALMSARIIQINNTPHILSITRDITERKILENTLVESEKKYRKLFERSNDAIFIIDKKTGKYLDANKSAEKITGYNINELKKLSTFDITPVDSKKRLSKISSINKAIELGEIDYYRSDGSTRHALLSVIPLSDDKVYGIAHDITERKQFEDALSILSSAVDQSPVSVVITDTNGLIEYANPKFSEITGYKLEEVIGKNPSVLKSGFTSNEEYKNLWKTISQGKEWRGVFQNQKKNGEMFWESALISPITNEQGNTTHYLAVKEDITEKKESERRILSSIIDTEEKERNRFSRELHDGLGPLLSTIKLYFQWISETNDQEKKKLIIEKGEKNINEAIETIREVSNNLSPRTLNTFGAIVAIRNFIDNVNHTQKILISLRSNTEARFEKNLETVLYRVTSELINNTLKYAKASKVDVNIYHEHNSNIIKLTYIDNGIGFNMESMLSKGKGLGLLNIEQRVNSLEGKFKIDSSEGHGVFVEIELPAPLLQIND